MIIIVVIIIVIFMIIIVVIIVFAFFMNNFSAPIQNNLIFSTFLFRLNFGAPQQCGFDFNFGITFCRKACDHLFLS